MKQPSVSTACDLLPEMVDDAMGQLASLGRTCVLPWPKPGAWRNCYAVRVAPGAGDARGVGVAGGTREPERGRLLV